MPSVRKKQKIRVQTFNGGQDSSSEPAVVKSPFASIAQNVVLDELGKATQREGLSLIGDNPDTLISKWTFDASDSTDDKGSNDGSDTSISYVDGKFGKAASFNGTTSKITVSADTTIDINTVDTFNFTCWVYVNSDGEGDTGRIFTKGSSYAQVQGETASTVLLRFVVDYDGTDANVVTSTTIPIDTWTKLEFHHNTDNSLDIIINGAIASYSTDTTGSGSLVDDSADDLILGNNSGQTSTFDGEMDDIRFYNDTRTADFYEQDKINGIDRYDVGSTVDRLYRARDVHIERLDDNHKGWTVVDSSFTADLETNFVQAKDILFILNGTDNVYSMDSSESFTDEANTNTDPPRTTVGAWSQNNRLFLGGSKTVAQRDFVWFSNSLDPQTFDRNTNVFKVRSGGGGAVTWLKPFKLNEMIIYKGDSVFALDMTGATPLTDWTLQPINEDIGCLAGRTVQDIGNDHIFLDDEGFVRLLSRTAFDKLQTSIISTPVQDILDTINIDAITKATSEFVDGKYYLAFPTGTNTENNMVLMWDSVAARLSGKPEAGWTAFKSDDWNVGDFTSFEFGDNKLSVVVSDNRAITQCYQHTGNTDNGGIIEMEIAGPQHDLGQRGTDKIWGPVYVVANAGEATTLDIQAEVDAGGFESIGTISLTGGAPVLPIALEFNLGGSDKAEKTFHVKKIGRGRTCRVKARHATYNVKPTFLEYELWSEQRIPRTFDE